MVILAIDPSLQATGWGIIEDNKVLAFNTIWTYSDETDSDESTVHRMDIIACAFWEILGKFKIDKVVIESPPLFVRTVWKGNSKIPLPDSLRKLATAYGVIMGVIFASFEPKDILSVNPRKAGLNIARKEKARAICKSLELKVKNDNEADAICLGLWFYNRITGNKQEGVSNA